MMESKPFGWPTALVLLAAVAVLAILAAIGAGLIGYFFGLKRGQRTAPRGGDTVTR